MESWVDAGGWLYIEIVHLSAGSHPSAYEPLDSNPTGSWTHNLAIISPTFYRWFLHEREETTVMMVHLLALYNLTMHVV